ncbi:protein trafficking Pga2 [Lasiosphaeria hispida]|uniref:Protein trafficking Pga2 n=1 Tax=Lasiosphaeria hispida TaxID=260671 RepID=A0AAJ0HR37_9PEZI|nr:protein trafficking Pga2 [Lasiosphaeria hispida]
MDELITLVSTLANRITANLRGSLENMSPEKWIRLVIIAGAYALLRPYIIKLGGRAQMNLHEQEAAEEVLSPGKKAAISPNELRGRVQLPEDSDSDEDDDEGTGTATGHSSAADWGKKARRRQRDMIKRLLDAEEKRLQETKDEEEDKDIEEFLVG